MPPIGKAEKMALENGARQLIHSKSPTLKNSHRFNFVRKNW